MENVLGPPLRNGAPWTGLLILAIAIALAAALSAVDSYPG